MGGNRLRPTYLRTRVLGPKWNGDVGDSPSTLRLIYPECYLNQGLPDIPAMHRCMIQYKEQFLTRGVEGFVLVERQTTQGIRLGLVARHRPGDVRLYAWL